jgi:type IV pilus assembly protein PilW
MRIALTPGVQKGLTLIEILIALGLSATITLGLTQLFLASSQTYKLLEGQALVQDAGIFSIEFISRAAQRAGYKGCFSKNGDLYQTFLADIPYEFNLNVGLEGYEGETSAWSPGIETTIPKTVAGVDSNVYVAGTDGAGRGINTNKIVRGTDIVTFRYISTVFNRLAADMPTSTEEIDVVPSSFEFGTDHMAYIHDCEKGTIFRVTGINAAANIQHSSVVDPDGYTNSFSKLAKFNTFDTDAYVNAIVTKTFFIAPGLAMNDEGEKPLSLWQKNGISAPVEIVEGVEDLQITYGIDTDSDDIPNRYVDADAVLDFDDVLMIRVQVTTNSVNDVGGTKTPSHGCVSSGGSQECLDGLTYDGLLRRTFTQTIALRNQS